MQKELQKIGRVLVGEGILTREEIRQGIVKAGLKGTAVSALLEKCHHVSDAELAAFLASDFSVPLIEDLRKFDLVDDAERILPEKLARKYGIVPLVRMGEILCVARSDYFQAAGISEVRKETGLRLKVFLAEKRQLEAALERMYGNSKAPIPAPKIGGEDETRVIGSSRPAVKRDAIPLIGPTMDPDEEVLLVDDPGPADGVLTPIVVSPHEYGAAEKDRTAEMIRAFEETFLRGTIHPAQRVR
jgi:hypothetical protein